MGYLRQAVVNEGLGEATQAEEHSAAFQCKWHGNQASVRPKAPLE